MLRTLFFLLLLPCLSFGQIPEPLKGTYINDHTGSLTAPQIEALNQQLYSLEQRSGIQVAILLITSLPADMAIEEYARQVGNEWKLGTAHNGIVYVAALNDHRQRLEIARNLEGDIPDITASEIIESLKPYLRQQDYYTAVSTLIAAIGNHLGMPMTSPNDSTSYGITHWEQTNDPSDVQLARSEYDEEKAKYDMYGDIALVIIALLALIFCFWAYLNRKKYKEMYTKDGGYTGIGSAGYVAANDSETFDIVGSGAPGTGGSGGGYGGFGGGGGGGFSGGGASGSW